MKVLFVTENDHPWSGSSTQLSDLAEGLNSSGHAAYLLVRRQTAVPLNLDALKDTPWGAFSRIGRYSDSLAVACEQQRVSLIHTHIEMLPSVVSHLRHLQLPIVANYGSSEPLSKEIIKTFGDKRVRAVVSISESGARHLRRQLPSRVIVSQIRQSTRLRRNPMESNRRDSIVRAGYPYILMAAAFRQYKGVIMFARAMEQVRTIHRNCIGVVVGFAPHKNIQALARHLQEKVAWHSSYAAVGPITFPGASNWPASWMESADAVVCCSSSYEGIPGAIREAMALGRPVICTSVGFAEELIHNQKTGIILPKRNSSSLANAILHLLTQPKETQRMGYAASQFVAKNFTYAKRMRLHLNLYRNLIATHTEI